eukprot:CAMPEP_0175468738 /NCGR_PEP_ID=MMETSP0095-20121207/71981_1 /TAXON_ID=311494 /ORGANISM="Alexandrium monilatum, Strain CCMP3105" /LENGTH=59 /DNA_ID=CAMNT_0016770133 /DNA_START=278 /DNA_END=453 /DNA_ORIENTATION=-
MAVRCATTVDLVVGLMRSGTLQTKFTCAVFLGHRHGRRHLVHVGLAVDDAAYCVPFTNL